MFDAKRLLDQLVNSGAVGGLAGGLAGGTLASALSGKQGRKLAGSALQLGGLALVGGLAYKAWQGYQQRQGGGGAATAGAAAPTGHDAPVEAPTDTRFMPAAGDTSQAQALSLLLARAMISAAKADGQIDTQESQAILNQINSLQLPAEDKAFLFEEYGRPLDLLALARDVDSPEHAAEVYTASALMVEPPSPAERIYLDSLARALDLAPGLVQQIHAALAANQTG